MPLLGRSFWALVIGICSISAITVGVFVLWLKHADTLQNSHHALVLASQKTSLATAMLDSVRKRSFSLAAVQNMDDYFERDAERQRFSSFARDYVVARDRLLQMKIPASEKVYIEHFQILVRDGRQVVERAMKGMVDDPASSDNLLLVKNAVTLQAEMFDQLSGLVRHLTDVEWNHIEAARQENARSYNLLVPLGGVALGLILLIASSVIVRERGYLRALGKEVFDRQDAENRVRALNTTLEGRVKERTKELYDARMEADTLRQRLIDALEAIPNGFSVVDAKGKLELFNEQYRDMYPIVGNQIKLGMPFADLLRLFAESGVVSESQGDVEGWIEQRMRDHAHGNSSTVQHLSNGRHIRIVDRKMRDGGIVSVQTDITTSIEAKEMAESANRTKTDFLASMSHELRTPLNAIIGFSQLLMDDPSHPLQESQHEELGHIYEAGGHLLSLIEDVLDFAKIDSGRMKIELTDVAVLDILYECRTMLQPLLKKYCSSLELDTASLEGVVIRADKGRFHQVMLNLMSNAIKYNRPHGVVTVTGTALPGGPVRVGVSDMGKGIPESKRQDLFKPFSRLGFEATTIEGTGIGLVLTKELVEKMDGVIGLESVPDEGTTFWVEFARAEPARLKLVETDASLTPVRIPDIPNGPGDPLDVLYIEDNPVNMKLLQQLLARLPGVTFVGAATGESGIEIARNAKPDLIFMDINLPGINGYQALNVLKADAATADIPVIAVTSDAGAANIQRGMNAGFFDYIEKPFRAQAIIDTLDRFRHQKTQAKA